MAAVHRPAGTGEQMDKENGAAEQVGRNKADGL